MHAPSDAELTEHGMAATGTGRLLVLACGALAREILALIRVNGWDHVDLHCLPAILHNYPNKITGAVREAVIERRDGYEKVFVAYADCGTGGDLEKACAELGVEMIRGPHCYAFFEGLDVFTGRDEIYSFYLTDFLARQFDTFIWRGLKIDRHPELLPMYFGHYRTLVYLAQTDDPALTEKAQAAAEKLGLRFERRFTGYGELASALEAAV
ncbi:DUF1638 domain-containing protein [Pseudooceanicola atlanticus]|uniref:DUF1638 domain-containing protein n=1 Tax=Pseudooceanicola atlanticus TaxID=1461694 RepID=A0A0A0EE13_9RHOB|nr:DUF1638 domain-containing protein [Pseudooceanicola atlanticus]KGM47427.1 hypothetical protein ATO9_18710 [Pseudooceanicola atlanticus]